MYCKLVYMNRINRETKIAAKQIVAGKKPKKQTIFFLRRRNKVQCSQSAHHNMAASVTDSLVKFCSCWMEPLKVDGRSALVI